MKVKIEIRNKGVVTTYYGPLLPGLLCKFGLHRWKYFSMSSDFIKMFPNTAVSNRRCERCKLMETTDDGYTWHGRL